MKDYDSFAAEWMGHKVDYDHVYAYQCVDLILEYIYECYGIAVGVSGNAIDYWNKPSAPLLTKFYKVSSTDAQKGDIVVLAALAAQPYGHIGIASGNQNGTDVEILEQNGQDGNGSGIGGDAIRTRYIPKSHIAGLLRPIAPIVIPPVMKAPYTIQDIDPKQVQLVKDSWRYDLTLPNITEVSDETEGISPKGTVFVAEAIIHHTDGYDYYMPNLADPSGFLVQDCSDYVPTVAPAPVVAASLPPAGALPVPTNVQKYNVVRVIMYYLAAAKAMSRQDPVGTINSGNYLIFKTDPSGMLNITKTQGSPQYWINPADNIPDPAPTPAAMPMIADTTWKSTYVPMNAARKSVKYVVMTKMAVKDISGQGPSDLHFVTGDEIPIFGTFIKDNATYGRVFVKGDTQHIYWYGVPLGINPITNDPYVEPEQTIYDPSVDTATKQAQKNPLTFHDYEVAFISTIENAADRGRKFMDIITFKKQKK